MKKFLWFLTVCVSCTFLTIPAEEEPDAEEPVEEEAPQKAPAKKADAKKTAPKAAPKKAAKKTDPKKAAKKTDAKKTDPKKAAKKAPSKPVKKAAEKKEELFSWRFIGPFRTGYQDNLRKSAVVCKNLSEVQAAVKKQKFNWNPKNIKGVTFSRKKNSAVLIVTGNETTLRQLQNALSKAFNNEIRTLTFVDKEDLTPAHFAAAKPPAPPKPKTAPKAAESEAED